MSKDNIRISPRALQNFVEQIFAELGFAKKVAERAAEVLVMADLRGVDSHGVARLPGYIRQVDEGIIHTQFQPKVLRETSSTASVDGDSGLGLYNAGFAADIAMQKAKEHGSGWVSIQNSSHFGIAAAHVLQGLEEGLMGFAMTNASPLVAPAGGKDRLLGTNPICVCIPSGKEPPFVLDMATTVVANGKLEVAKRAGMPIPEGYAQTAEGKSTTDAEALIKGGSMLPLGGSLQHSSYKGYGLGAWVDIMTGVLSGANFGLWVPPFVPFLGHNQGKVGEGIGHFVGFWNVEAFMDRAAFNDRMDKWLQTFRKSQAAEGLTEVLIPGEPERRMTAKRKNEGIPLQHEVYEQLQILANRFDVNLPAT